MIPANPKNRVGFTLIEVILALTVLAVSLALLGQLVGLGFQNAQQAQGLTEAQMIAETIMEEIALGLIPPDPVTDMNVTMTSDLPRSRSNKTRRGCTASTGSQPRSKG